MSEQHSPNEKNGVNAQPNHSTSEPASNKTTGTSKDIGANQPSKPEPEHGHHCPQPKTRLIEWLTLLAALASLALVFRYVNTVNAQLGEMIIANATSRKTFIATQRAYVNAIGLDLVPVPKERPTLLHVSVIVQNSGNTPTRDLWWSAAISHVPINPAQPMPELPTRQDLSGVTRNYGTLAPHGENKRLISLGGINARMIEALKAGRQDSRFVGALIYKDFFSNETHITRFCYRLFVNLAIVEPPGVSYSMCPGNSNCTDEGCEDKSEPYNN
jgi:hypothetical protein